jgi:hypothetical protein
MKRIAKHLESLIPVVCVTGMGIFHPVVAVAAEGLSEEILQCSRIEDSVERLECFDSFAGRDVQAETVSQEPAQAVTSEPQIRNAPDDLGAENLPPGAREKVEELAVRAVVTSCTKDAYGKYLFYFDNGQVWKQKNDKRMRFTKCEFEVTITQDFFGYKMQRVGETSRIRIARVK